MQNGTCEKSKLFCPHSRRIQKMHGRGGRAWRGGQGLGSGLRLCRASTPPPCLPPTLQHAPVVVPRLEQLLLSLLEEGQEGGGSGDGSSGRGEGEPASGNGAAGEGEAGDDSIPRWAALLLRLTRKLNRWGIIRSTPCLVLLAIAQLHLCRCVPQRISVQLHCATYAAYSMGVVRALPKDIIKAHPAVAEHTPLF